MQDNQARVSSTQIKEGRLGTKKNFMTPKQALAFVREHGVVLASGKGPVPRLTEAIINEPIKGSWWAHPKCHQIFAVFQVVSASDDILVCRLVDEKVTFVHRRLWPALVRTAAYFSARQLAQVHQEHTAAGHHVSHDVAFPKWVPSAVVKQAHLLDEDEALEALGTWTSKLSKPIKTRTIKRRVISSDVMRHG